MEYISDAFECVLQTPAGNDEKVMIFNFDPVKIPARVKDSSALF